MLDLEDEQDAFVQNVTFAQIKKWKNNPSDHHLITKAYDQLESLLRRSDGDTSWIPDHLADYLDAEAGRIKEREEQEAAEARLREDQEAAEARLREEVRGLKRKLETLDAKIQALAQEKEELRAKQEAVVSVWSNLMAHDPRFIINASSTGTTSIPHFYSPDIAVPWDFANFNECEYSSSYLQEFVGKLVAFQEKRSAFPESIVYLRDHEPGTSEQCVVDIMKKLYEAVKHILKTTNEPNSDKLSYKSGRLYGVFDFVSRTLRQPDGVINLESFPICMIEYKTDKTFTKTTLEEYDKSELKPFEESSGPRTKKYESVKHPVTQVCSYMMLTGFPLHGAYGVGFSDSTLEIAGITFNDCFAKASLYLDDETSYDTGYNLNNEQATEFMGMLVEEARLYDGAARALQGSVLPVVHYSGEFPIGGGFYFMIVMSNTGHSLRSEVGQQTARSVGLNAVHSRVHALLDKLHGAGITHGDMGLRNVTIQENGTVRLVDLGMASLDLRHCRQDYESFDAEWTRAFGRIVVGKSMLRRFSPTQFLKSLHNGSDQS
ncbi:Casein kinase 1-like protein HD16 [Hondaea fermentalgiana]|uniref:Casein kinase 1-like protein HD16 n=1 Tax=Hondaea fermentalgiana TaxID=2315210 RepID=A0A2R5G1Z7_9STRA|nr:Casein kinase 1-like protein HD16 [Hondaea fermentalgiana]|eukprot:GBG25047.1 Casein kinase 1-like protein HD16 [Hondaea fermentalgiana]